MPFPVGARVPDPSSRWPRLQGLPPSLLLCKSRGNCVRTPWGGRGGIPLDVCCWVFLGYEEGDGRDIIYPHPQSHVGVRQLYLDEIDLPEMQVGGEYLLDDALERTTKAHCLHGG